MAVSKIVQMRSVLLVSIVLGGATLLSAAGSSQAGFEWLPDGESRYTDTPETDPGVDVPAPSMPNSRDIFLPIPVPANEMPPPPAETLSAPVPKTTSHLRTLTPAQETLSPAQKVTQQSKTPAIAAAPFTGTIGKPMEKKRTVKPLLDLQEETPGMPSSVEAQPLEAPQDLSVTDSAAPAAAAKTDAKPAIKTTTSAQSKPGRTRVISNASETAVSAAAASTPAAATAPAADGEYAVVSGFGDEMPMALALREIVPPHYAFSFGEGVNAGYRVSWNGGKPWNEVVYDMISPLELSAYVRGNKLFIVKKGQAGAAASANAQRKPQELSVSASAQGMTEQGMSASSAAYQRMNITDPGEKPRAQSEQTLSRIKQLSANDNAPAAISEPQPLRNMNTAPKTEKPAAEAATDGKDAFFEAAQGKSLKDTLTAWSKEANVTLVWSAAQDYKVTGNVFVNGTFKTALKTLMTQGMGNSAPSFTFVETPGGETVGTVVVQDKA